MPLRAMKSWKLSKSVDPFYPFGIRCIGSGTNYALSIWSAFTVDNLIFRNFQDALRRDDGPQKAYLTPSLEPDCIVEMVVGAQESVILMKSGLLKYFKSPKKLMTVEYLQDICAICSCHEGFVMIKTPCDGIDIVVEFHPDAFPRIDDENENRRQFDISIGWSPAQGTWKESNIVIKEFTLPIGMDEAFRKFLFQSVEESMHTTMQYAYFFVIDNNFASFIVDPAEDDVIISHIFTSPTSIRNFWMAENGNAIFLLLESCAIECLWWTNVENKLKSQSIYLDLHEDIESIDFSDDLLVYSDGFTVVHGKFVYDNENDTFEYNAKTEEMPGIAAITILKEWKLILCISENNLFYVLPFTSNEDEAVGETWMEVDNDMQQQIQYFREDVIELNEEYENLSKELKMVHQMTDVANLYLNQNPNEFFFTARVKASKAQPEYSLAKSTIYISNNLVLDQDSFFLRISMVPMQYRAEFNAHLWNLRLRWTHNLNGPQQCVNLKLLKESLLKSFDIIMHVKSHTTAFCVPHIDIEINAPIAIGQSCLYVLFPVKTEQVLITDLLELHSTKPAIFPHRSLDINLREELVNKFFPSNRYPININPNIIYKIKLPPIVKMEQIYSSIPFQKYASQEQKNRNPKEKLVHIVVLGTVLNLSLNVDNNEIMLSTSDAGVMFHIKKLLFTIIANNLPDDALKSYKIPRAIIKEYTVSNAI